MTTELNFMKLLLNMYRYSDVRQVKFGQTRFSSALVIALELIENH